MACKVRAQVRLQASSLRLWGGEEGGKRRSQTSEGCRRGARAGGMVAEDLKDSLGHLAPPKHVCLAGESTGLGGGLLGNTLYIRELGAGVDPNKGGRQLVAAAGTLNGDVMPS